jgi:hypothetical protein
VVISSSADLSSAEARREYEAEFEALRDAIPVTPARALAQRFVRLDKQLDAGMKDAKSAMLVPSLLGTHEDQALGFWIHRQHAELGRMGCIVVLAAVADTRVEEATTLELVALALMHLGEAVKWELIAGRPGRRDYAALHELARLALERRWLHTPCTLVMDGLERTASVDALYFRALLLDRFSSGSLSRQQIEVLDAFLWEWMPALVSQEEPGNATMRADLDSEHGLRYGVRHGDGPSLYLSLETLEAQRLAVIQSFHAGQVVPSRGRAAEIRLEAHVAVLAQLRQTFLGDDVRAPREPAEPARVEAWVGLAEITHRVELDERMGPGADDDAGTEDSADRYERVYERPHRWLELVDASETGWLLEAQGDAAQGLVVGELLGLRFHPGTACVLGCVVRSVRRADGEASLVGVQRLSHPARRLRPCAMRSDTREEGTYIFVPGDDPSGRRDSFAVPYRLLEANERILVQRGGRDFALEFNRVRRRGRGWALAGYEMVDATAWDIIVA